MKTTFETTHFAVRISTLPEALIEVIGELDLASVPTFQDAIRKLNLSGGGRVVLDLGRLAFIDAAGLHAVLDLQARCLTRSTVLTILPGPRNVQRVFVLAGVEQIMPFGSSSGPTVSVRPDSPEIGSGDPVNSIPRLPGESRNKKGDERRRNDGSR